MNGTPIDPIILSVIFGLAGAVLLVAALIKWHKPVLAAIERAFKALFTFNGFFWIVNLSCMAYSAQNAGYVFGLYEPSGFAIGLALDGLIIVFTQVALTAKARGEVKRAGLILLFIAACCLLSMIGNLAHNLHTDISTQTSGVWFQQIVPYVTSMVPLLLIALAWVADLKIDPMEKEKPEVYEANEKKRLQFHIIQIESHERREALQTRAIAVEVLRRRNSALRRGKTPGSFRWFWEKAVDAGEIIAGVSAQLTALFNPQIEEMKRELEALRNEKEEFAAHVEQVNAEKMTLFQQSCRTFISQLIEEIRVDFSDQNEHYRLALGQQYDQDITLVKNQLTSRIDGALSDVKRSISQDVIALKEEFNQAIIASRKPVKSDNVIERTPEVEIVVKRYPIVDSWFSRSERSVTLQEIIDGTGHTSQMVHKRAKDKTFRRTRAAGYYRLDSVIRWLRTAPLPRPKEEIDPQEEEQEISSITQTKVSPDTDEIEAIGTGNTVTNSSDINVTSDEKGTSESHETEVTSQEITTTNSSDINATSDEEVMKDESSSAETEVISQENITTNGSDVEALPNKRVISESSTGSDKLTMTVAAMRKNPAVTEEELRVILGLKRPASTRFWKVKAQDLLNKEQPSEERVLEYATA